MPTNTILTGNAFTLVVNTIFATPPRLCTYTKSGAGTVEVSNDASAWAAITPDANGNFTTAAPFMRATGANAIVTPRV